MDASLHHSPPESGRPEREHRQRVLKGASILRGVDESEIACTVRNMHAHGAELRVPDEVSIPDAFLLYIPIDRTAYRCELRWRMGSRAGVTISGTAPKPHWHYG